SARVTELALRRFEAQLFKTKGLRYDIQQKIIEKENEINFLLGRYPVPIIRSELPLDALLPGMIDSGVPLELLQNRPDVRQAEQQLAAAELDIEVARARFYPSLQLSAGAGYSAYRTEKLFESPTSLFYSLAGGLTAPFLNRRDIEAEYKNASAAQRQAVRNYEQTVLRAYIEVENQLAHLRNLKSNVGFRSQEVKALDESIQISTTLFNSARADYMEVLLTQREALDSKFDLIETKQRQLRSAVELYRALGGGWSAEEKEEVRPSHSASSGDRVL
ncbi:TolC family protein, partial [bacterium]|nr:TolC family protein [bacterium]